MTESASQDNSGIDALSPERFFSSGPEADGSLLRWAALRSYFDHLAERTALVRSAEIGFDWSGLPLQLVVISSARNMARLEEIRDIQRRLSDPRGIATVAERDRLIADAPCVVAITCSIHATEVGGSQGAPWFAHDLISTSPELLDDVVILLVPCLNPGGLELVVDWRERWRGKSHEGVPPPELYHPFCGHDNNRDWVMQSQPEIRAVVEHVHRRWSPHIVVDLHELVPNGPRYVVPPYIEPVDPNVPALLEAGAATLGSHIAAALLLAGKTGVVSGALFDAYSPMRAYPFHHGGVRVLAEAAGTRLGSPATISWESLAAAPEFDPHLRGPRHLAPWPGGRWTLRDVIDHHRIAVAAVAEHASRFRARWVRTAWHARAETCARAEPAAYVLLPYIWQRDPGAALELADLLRTGDLEVSASLDAFEVNGVEFPPGSLLLLHGQPNWGYAVTLLGAEDYPMRRRSPSGPVQTPYDVTGHNLPLLMGVDVVALPSAPTCQTMVCESIPAPLSGLRRDDAKRFVLDASANGAHRVALRALAAGGSVGRLDEHVVLPFGLAKRGAFVVEAVPVADLRRWCDEARVLGHGVEELPCSLLRISGVPRVGIYRSWKPSSTDEGWSRFMLDGAGFAPGALRDGDLRSQDRLEGLDVVLLPHQPPRDLIRGNDVADFPREFCGGIGRRGMASLLRWVRSGGTLVAVDGAAEAVVAEFRLPLVNRVAGMAAEAYSAPGSIVRFEVDAEHPVGWGCEPRISAMVLTSPAFADTGTGPAPSAVIARYPMVDPLLAGWMHGDEHVRGLASIVEMPVARGRVILFGCRPLFRAQARGTYKLLFNALLSSVTESLSANRIERGARP